MQIAAGVDAVQIFDSVGGLLPAEDFEAASGRWMGTIVSALNGQAPVIVYSKGTRAVGSRWSRSGRNAIGIDHGIALEEAEATAAAHTGHPRQSGPRPCWPGAEPAAVAAETRRLLELMRGRNGYIFNLGHGVPPDAKMENLEALVSTVQNFA